MHPRLFILAVAVATAARAAEPPTEPILRIEAGMHTAMVRQIPLDRAGRFLLSASFDKSARLWDARSGELLRTYRPPLGPGDEGKLNAAALSPDAAFVAVAGWTGWNWDGQASVYVFDRRTGAMLRRIGGLPSIVDTLAFAPDSQRLAVGMAHKGIRIFRVQDGELLASDVDYGDTVYGLDFDGIGRLAATGFDGSVRLYDPRGQRVAKVAATSGKQPFRVAFSPDGSRIALGFNDVPAVDVLSGADLSLLFSPPTTAGNRGWLSTVRWSADGHTLAAGGALSIGGTPLRLWANDGRAPAKDVLFAQDSIQDIAAMPNGGFAVASGEPRFTSVDPAGNARTLRAPAVANFGNCALRASEDGTKVAFGYEKNFTYPAAFSIAERALAMGASNLPEPRTTAEGLAISDWRSSFAPTVNGKRLPMDSAEASLSLAISPSGQSFLLGSYFNLRHFDRNGNELWLVPAPEVASGVTFAAQGRLAIAAFGDGTIRWFRAADGAELLAFFPHADRKRWVLWTPSGYYDASPGGEELIGWHVNRGKDKEADFFPAARFRSRFYRPDVVSLVLTTLDEKAALSQADEDAGRKQIAAQKPLVLPPVVRIVSPATGDSFGNTEITLRVQARSPSGAKITAVRALVDGRPAIGQRGVKKKDDSAEGELTLTVPVPPRDCELAVFAEAGDSVGEPDRIKLRYASAAPLVDDAFLPKLYVLAIGVSNYSNPELKLDYPAKDATDLAAVLKRQKGALFRDVGVKVLTDEAASKDEIIDALDWLQKQTTARDVAVLFLAGHGMNDPSSGAYQFLPVGANPAKRSTLLPDSEIKTTLRSIAGKVVVMLDTCHAGSVMGDRKMRAVDSNGFVNELASSENGVVVFTAATGRQSSQESKQWGNGAFTKALIEALSGKADFRKTGRVTVNMVDLYVSERVKELTGGQQTPVTAKPGGVQDFPLAADK